MSKKRGRSTAASKADEGPDAQFAEELMFQLASDDNEPENPPSAKRGKSTSAKILPTSSAGTTDLTGADLDDSVTTAAEGGESTSAAAQEPSNGKHPAAIRPSSSLRHCDGFDVVRKGSRGRGRQLMVLPGALGLGGGSAGGTAGVKLGVLNTATPGCPVLYVEFPEVRGVVLGCLASLLDHVKSVHCGVEFDFEFLAVFWCFCGRNPVLWRKIFPPLRTRTAGTLTVDPRGMLRSIAIV